MNYLETIENELHIICDGEIIHVFEQGRGTLGPDGEAKPPLSKAAYKHMCAWVITNFDSKLSAEELWVQAEKSWDSLTREQQMIIWAVIIQEEQNAYDISQGLLATLNGYQCLSGVKAEFSDGIKRVRDQFISQ